MARIILGIFIIGLLILEKEMIIFAESLEERPIDRDYNAHGGSRITQPEILGGGIAYCVRIAYPGQVVIGFKEDEDTSSNSEIRR